MSKLTKGLAVSTLAAGIAVLYGTGAVSAGADYGSYMNYKPQQGSYSSNDVHFGEQYDKAASYFFSLKEDEKKDNSESYSYNNGSYNFGGQNDKHGDKKGGWGSNDRGNSVSIDYQRNDSSSKSLEQKEAASSKESYASDFMQSSNRGNYGGGWGQGSNYVNNSVKAAVNFNKEYNYAASVKAEASHSSSVSNNFSLANYGNGSSNSASVSAFENMNQYSKIEASVAESQKEQSSVSYSADNSQANFGGFGGGSMANNSINYNATSSSESSREMTYSAEQSSSYSSGLTSNTSSNQGGYGGQAHDYGKMMEHASAHKN